MLLFSPQQIQIVPRLIGFVLLLMAFAVLGHYWVQGELNVLKEYLDECLLQWGTWVLVVGSLIYLLLLSLPFVPGVELGLLIMCVFGQQGILPVYFATVGGLMLAFTVGQKLPKPQIAAWMKRLGLLPTSSTPNAPIYPRMEHSILSRMMQRHPWLEPYLRRYRYVSLVILFNLPGNYLIGGGGGIALTCGFSGQFRWLRFLLTVMIATAPIPLLVWFGFIQLENWLELGSSPM